MSERFTATVMRSTGSWYEVRREDGSGGSRGSGGAVSKARVRGRLRLGGSRSTNPVVVGDRVECSFDEGEVWIERVLPRRNYIIRRSSNLSRESHIIAANVDQALVVATLFSPVTSTEFIDRFLVTCEAYGVPATILLNKMDLAMAAQGGEAASRRFTEIYRRAGYPVMQASVVAGEDGEPVTEPGDGLGISELREFLRGRTTLISGNSGVGKSTLIKAVSPGLDVRIGEISRAHGKGMHTTTFSQMYPLGACRTGGLPRPSTDAEPDHSSNAPEGFIIDTPGIKGFGLIDIGGAELSRYFPEMMRVAPGCQYYNCTHTHEPGCAVVRAVEAGEISGERYASYLKMLEEDEKYRS